MTQEQYAETLAALEEITTPSTLDRIVDLMRHAIDSGQAVTIKADDVKIDSDGETMINGLEISTEA